MDVTDADILKVPAIPHGNIIPGDRKWSVSAGHTRAASDDVEVKGLL